MLQILKQLFFLIIWFPLAIIDMLIVVFKPKNRFHNWINKLYKDHVKSTLTNGRMSRISYTFAYGSFHIFMIIFILLTIFVFFFNYQKANEVKNKFMIVNIDSKTKDNIRNLTADIHQIWETEYDSLQSSEAFFIGLIPDTISKDIANFSVEVKSNFNLEMTPIFKGSHRMSDSINTPNYCKFDINYSKDKEARYIDLHSNAHIFNDPETPFVNFYLSFNKNNTLLPYITDSIIHDMNEENKIDIWLCSQIKGGIGNMPYDVVSIKPEPETNSPYYISYSSPEKIREVLNRGIYISTVNRDLKAQRDREAFLKSVLIGALLSLLFSIIIEIFRKWKNINTKEGAEDPYC